MRIIGASSRSKEATRGQKERRRSNIFFLLGSLGGFGCLFVWLFLGGFLSVLFHCLFFRKHIHAEGGFFGGDDKR